MLETIANFITDWTYTQYRRFGYWLYAPPAVVVLLLGVWFAFGWKDANEKRAHGGMTDAEWKLLMANNAQEAEGEAREDAAQKEKKAAAEKAKAEARAKAAAAVAAAAASKSVVTVHAEPEPKSVPSVAARPSLFPANLADWRKDDFLRARASGEPRLAEAIVALGKRTVGNQATAGFLISLLADPPEPPSPATSGAATPAKTGTTSKTTKPAASPVGPVVAALAANGTAAAQTALRDIAGGRMATANEPTARAAAMEALAHGGDRDGETMLLTAVTAPSQLPPLPAGALDELQKGAAAVIRTSGSESLRLRLAQYLVQPDTPPAIRQRFAECLMDARSENIAAATLLYACEELDPKVRGVLEQRFTAWSAEALARGLGLPASQAMAATTPLTQQTPSPPARLPPGEGRTPNSPPSSLSVGEVGEERSVDPADAIPILWTNEFVENVARRLSLAETLDQALGTLKLAAVLPCPSSRAAIHDLLQKHYYEVSATSDFAPGWFNTVSDPGVLLVLKELPRKGLPEQKSGAVRRGARAGTSAAAVKPVRVSPAEQIKQQHALAEEWWIRRSLVLVQNWCTRLHRAALAAPERSRASGKDAANEFPVPLRPNGRVTAVFHCPWPGRLGGKVPVAARDSLDVYYVRLEEKAQPDEVVSYYKHQLASTGATVVQRPAPRGLWLDVYGDAGALTPGPSPDGRGENIALTPVTASIARGESGKVRKRSIDVLVYKAVPDAPALHGEETDLVIEILLIEGS